MATLGLTRRRRTRGNAWYWRQTDTWYFTPPGTKHRIRLVDEDGRPIRGEINRKIADLALARVKVAGDWRPEVDPLPTAPLQVANACSQFVAHCKDRAAKGFVCSEYCKEVARYLNELCSYCGALPVTELRKGHIEHWLESHPSWRSPVTRRNIIAIVLAAFNYFEKSHDAPNPLRGLKKPPTQPRLQSFSAEEERKIYAATDKQFADFLRAAIHTGLRPFCELARLKAADVLETDRGMMWRVYSSKTRKTRKIPVRHEIAKLTRRLLGRPLMPSGSTVFCNPLGRPWKKVTGGARFRKIKVALGWDKDPVRSRFSCYTCRHTFAHRMLAGFWNDGAGCSIEVLAELMGDTPKVAFDHYGKAWGQHYQEPLWAAIGLGGGSDDS